MRPIVISGQAGVDRREMGHRWCVEADALMRPIVISGQAGADRREICITGGPSRQTC
jgi:hypothetical protein